MFRNAISARTFATSSIRSSFANATLLGNVGQVKTLPSRDGEQEFISFSLAVNRYKRDDADWFNIAVYSKNHVDFFSQYISPGTKLYVEADLRNSQSVNEETGEKKYYQNLVLRNFDVVQFKKTEVEEE